MAWSTEQLNSTSVVQPIAKKSPASPKGDAGVLAGNHHAMAKLRGMGPLLSPTSLGDVQESRLLSPPFSKRDVSMKFVAKAEASPEKHK